MSKKSIIGIALAKAVMIGNFIMIWLKPMFSLIQAHELKLVAIDESKISKYPNLSDIN